MYSEENRSLYLLSYTHTHTRNLPSPINRTPGEQEGKNQIQSGYWFGGVFENGRELCVHLHTPHHVKAHFCQKQPQFLFKGVSEAHEAAAGELSCLLCKSDDNCNWLYTIKHHCDSCLTRHLYWCIKLSNKFPYDCTTTPCQTTELAEKSVMINVIPPQHGIPVYVWRKGSKWSLFTSVQVVW